MPSESQSQEAGASLLPPGVGGYGMHTTFCDCPLTETLDFANLLTFSGVA